MNIEATIVEQLQELRRWQLQQQEELIRQQQEQREELSSEQSRIYEALSLSVDEGSVSNQSLRNLIRHEDHNEEGNLIDLNTPNNEPSSPASHSRNNSFSRMLSYSDDKNNNSSMNLKVPKLQLDIRNIKTDSDSKEECNNSHNQHNYSSELSVSSIQSLSQRKFLIDDMPVPSPKKDFETLLEERLRDSEGEHVEYNNKPVIKRPFLKKGQGLVRFMPNSNCDKKAKTTVRPRSASFTTGTQSSIAKASKPANVARCNSMPKSKKVDIKRKSLPNLPPVAQAKLTLKNVPPPKKKPPAPPNRSLPGSAEKKKLSNAILESSISDIEVKAKKELEEVRIFEMLEDKAENSSFCSTSSTVIAFLQQSTPLKHKALLHSAAKNKLSLNDIGDQTLEDIMRSTKTNHLTPFSPPQQKIIKKNQVPHWDDIPISKLKNDRTVTGAVLPYGTDIDITENDNEETSQDDNNVSLHVRFAEYNEYKTMTDTSSISSESQTITNYVSEKGAWSDSRSDCSATPDSSDYENLSTPQMKHDRYQNSTNQTSLESIKDSNQNSDDETGDFKTKQYDEEEDEDEEEENETYIESNNDTLIKNETALSDTNTAIADTSSIFKSELLKTRLLELEREIEIFRKESAALTFQRQKLQEERTKFQEERLALQRSYDEKEKALQMEKKRTETTLLDEKKRLAREKAALESRLKDAWEKAQKSKQERLEIEKLREEIEELKDELSQKESKWNANNARQRSQMRVLQAENSKLKQEIEKLQQKKNVRIKKPVTSNTRSIHHINKMLADRKKISPFKNDDVVIEEPVKLPETHADDDNDDDDDMNFDVETESAEEIPKEKIKLPKTAESITRTRNLYESLLREATGSHTDLEVERRNFLNKQNEREEPNSDGHVNNEEEDEENHVSGDYINGHKNTSDPEIPKSPQEEIRSTGINGRYKMDNRKMNSNTDNKQDIREVHHPDGRMEYWYPNGNVKKIFPDKHLTKMIYYNGDVRETDQNGTVKYFYAATRTWHTTLPDGLEILEFPDGQVERRSKDGTIEVSFPDGSVRIVQADGTEKWALKDGTIAETSLDGEKILTLPNGQREIHTKDHKRREYPDGTVKLVYPDGIQETRYANGRIRIKDKDGNLVMDTHQ